MRYWSNIHYGYIGMAAGFSESVLIIGAGIAHTREELDRSKTPEERQNIIREKLGKKLRSWEDSKDKAAIRLGIRLYRIRPGWVWTEDVVSQVRLSPISLRARPYRP